MICTLNGSTYTVVVTNAEVCDFAMRWPGHHLDTDGEYEFQFNARNGDLVDLTALREGTQPDDLHEEEDGDWLVALCDDACINGAEELGLRDVMTIRFGTTMPMM